MSRTNIHVLIATALLGLLLVVVYQLAGRLSAIPAEAADKIEIPSASQPTNTLPTDSISRVRNYEELLGLLNHKNLPDKAMLGDTAQWHQSRGSLGAQLLFGVSVEDAPLVYYQALDDTTLAGLSTAGDMGASQTLASRLISLDIQKSIDYYLHAASLGSVYALLQLASLFETIATFTASADRPVIPSANRIEKSTLKSEAFAYSFAALRDGGLPFATFELVGLVNRLYAQVPESQQNLACERSEQVLVEVSRKRRARGLSPIAADPPPVFLAVTDVDRQLPCNNTPYAYQSTLRLKNCGFEEIVGPHDLPANLFICITAR